ncbi:unnamed protein product, partial [Adineta steineri]
MIPISLRINLDMGKIAYAWFIQKDEEIPGSVVRSSTIPEELGRIGYLLSDKTGTLTQNLMIFKRLHLGTVSYTNENQSEISNALTQQYRTINTPVNEIQQTTLPSTVKALAICHNVTPVFEERPIRSLDSSLELNNGRRSPPDTPLTSATSLNTLNGSDIIELLPTKTVTYQASSPDEIALVEWTEHAG